ncbi:hypothetical protein OKW33_003371 [Paraburkholderia atlantica]|uniref:hypothetical protein n=1 Tax=Paraburkholderia atlantica TaxID=2654982 RepID=UPI003D24211D
MADAPSNDAGQFKVRRFVATMTAARFWFAAASNVFVASAALVLVLRRASATKRLFPAATISAEAL